MNLTRSQVRLLTYLDRCEHSSELQCAKALYDDRTMVAAVGNITSALLRRDGPPLIRSYRAAGRGHRQSVAITAAGRRALREQPAQEGHTR